MKRLILIIWVLAAVQSQALVADFHSAVLREIRRFAPEVAKDNIHLLASPPLMQPLQRVLLQRVIYDAPLRQWQIQLQCVPQRACLSFIAVVTSPDEALFRHIRAPKSAQPLIRPGERKELLFSLGAVRIRQRVVCLQAGRAGDSIRVQEQDGHKILLAIVAADGRLSLRRTP